MAAPEYLHLTGAKLALAFWGGFGFTVFLISSALLIALLENREKNRRGVILVFVIAAVVLVSTIVSVIWFLDKQELPEAQPPNFFVSLFMDDQKKQFSGATTTYSKDVTWQNYKTTIYYNLHYDVRSGSKFASLYIADFQHLDELCQFAAANFPSFFEEDEKTLNFGMKFQGQSDVTRTANLPFSGRVYLYVPIPLGLDDLSRIKKIFQDNKQSVQVKTVEYSQTVWETVRTGKIKMPQLYEWKNNYLVPVKP